MKISGKLVRTREEAQVVLNRLREHEGDFGVDVETSGLNPRRCHIVAYVLTFGPTPNDNYYIPVRHAGGGNVSGLRDEDYQEPTDCSTELHWFEKELRDIASYKQFNVIGHNLMFDLLFMAKYGIKFVNSTFSCTQVRQAMCDEFTPGFSLDVSSRHMNVTAKKGDELYAYIISVIGEEASKNFKSPRDSMGFYWKTAGDHPLVVDYALGDGITTWELYLAQDASISKQDLHKIWALEKRTTKTLFHMQHRGIRIDVPYMTAMREELRAGNDKLREPFLKYVNKDGVFGERSAECVKLAYLDHGFTEGDFRRTPTGKFSFTEDWMETNELGKQLLEIRKRANLDNSFITPAIEHHLFGDHIYPNYNQLKGDEFGTVSGRLSSNNPNIQQVPKHEEELSKLVRRGFIPDDGYYWSSNDYSQCLAGDTKVMVPGGHTDIKDLKIDDWVYSYTDDKKPTIKKVLWAGQTGVCKLYRLHWVTNGRTKGYLDATGNHPIRLHDGTYKTVNELIKCVASNRSKHNYNISVWAMRRAIQTSRGEKRNFVFVDGYTRFKESRLVAEAVDGVTYEEVHHIDGNTLNDDYRNLIGMTQKEHLIEHGKFKPEITTSRVVKLCEKLTQRQAAKKLGCSQATVWKRLNLGNPGNHMIIDIEELPGEHPVYDITVEDTHNFIANEICVHNCEPRIFAEYTQSQFLIQGYLSNPPTDLYNALAKITGASRQTCKRLALALFYGAGNAKAAVLIGCSEAQAANYRNQVYANIPEIKQFTASAAEAMRRRARVDGYGWVKSVAGRRLKIREYNFFYRASNRIVQATNADVIKHGINECHDYLESTGAGNLLLTCHDSIDWQVLIGRDDANDECRRIMEASCASETIPLEIPQKVDCGVGPNWAVATFGA